MTFSPALVPCNAVLCVWPDDKPVTCTLDAFHDGSHEDASRRESTGEVFTWACDDMNPWAESLRQITQAQRDAASWSRTARLLPLSDTDKLTAQAEAWEAHETARGLCDAFYGR